MMKYIRNFLSILLFFMAITLSGQDVDISIDHPERVNAGEDFEVTLTITKGSLSDYSRFSQDLPPGLTATNVSSPNADFSFDEQRIRIIWLKLPEENQIRVSYLISVDPRLKGTFTLGGVFAYVTQDERRFLDLDQQQAITIIPSSSMDPSQIVDISDFGTGVTPLPAAPQTVSRQGDTFAMAIRQKPVLLSSGAYQIHLLIYNPPGSKYAKVEETIPSGYMLEEVDSNDGIVSYSASTVKFIWMKLPEESEYEVIYRLVPIQGESQGTMIIKGELTYTAGNENRVADIVEMDVPLAALNAGQKKDLLLTGNIPEVSSPLTPAVEEVSTPAASEVSTPADVSNTGGASGRVIANTKVLDPGTGVYFRVQLTANRDPFDATTFYRDAGLNREVLVEQHDGYYKYTVGPFQTYNEALSYKDTVERLEAVEGAFVVGYRNGSRVSAGALR